MAARYLILVSPELLLAAEWPRCMHLSNEQVSARNPAFFEVQVLDDDAPEEFDGQHVELTFHRDQAGRVTVTDRTAVSF